MDLMEAAVEEMEAITRVVMIGVWQPPRTPDLPWLPVEPPRLLPSPSDSDRPLHRPLPRELNESFLDPNHRSVSSVPTARLLPEYPPLKHLGLLDTRLEHEPSTQSLEEVEVVYSIKCSKSKAFLPGPTRLIQTEQLVLGIVMFSSRSIYQQSPQLEVPLPRILIDRPWLFPTRLGNM